jgi:hypothetical protein
MQLVCFMKKKNNMELFNTTGFKIQDKVFVMLDGIKYFGTVIDIDDRLDRILVDYTSTNLVLRVKSWFHKSFWQKEK